MSGSWGPVFGDRRENKMLLLGFVPAVSFFLFIAVMAFISLVSPSLAFENMVVIFIAVLCVLTVIACCLAWTTVSSMVAKFNNVVALDPLREDRSNLRPCIQDLRTRSRWCRITSVSMLFVMVLVALAGFTVIAGSFDDNTRQSPSSEFALFVLLVILMRTLVSVYRYNLRLASFYDARADYLRLADNVKLSHQELLKLVGTDELDTTSIGEFWHSLLGRSSFREATKNSKLPPS